MTAIIDYEMGNLCSVKNALEKIGEKCKIIKNADELKKFDRAILPGVGAFSDAILHLKKSNFDLAINDFTQSGKNFLGICLGMQLLFDKSYEFGENDGLGLVDGYVKKFDFVNLNIRNKIPQMGWNTMKKTKETPLFKGLNDEFYLYFVHSYHVLCQKKYIIGKTKYGYEFASCIQKDNILGFQPHPEKSHDIGLSILKNFTEL